MIQLFNIPNYTINTKDFSHFLHGSIVEEFENNFLEYVGAKYACSVNSATNAIFLMLLDKNTIVDVPSLIPPVVLNAILTSKNQINFVDNISWVGHSYVLHKFKDYKIIDSAQRVDRNQFANEADDNDLMFFSFYPTKPVGSSDGGIIVSNDKTKIDYLRTLSFNGMSFSTNNWERKTMMPGYKFYLNSIQAYIANENLKLLDLKKEHLAEIRNFYNKELGYNNTSDHLYRINVSNRDMFIKYMKSSDILCGVHYEAQHLNPVYNSHAINQYENRAHQHCPKSEAESKQTISIPFHENLTAENILYIINQIKKWNS
jgi:dTDP-4-amino-4,6-dideoxygalactose transaminase